MYCFSFCFLITVYYDSTVYLPMLYKLRKVREFHVKELIAKNQILILERKTLIDAREERLLTAIKSKIKKNTTNDKS